MYNKFVRTANVNRFLAGYTALENRGAEESCLMLVVGQAGLGKTRTIRWWAAQPEINGVYIRATSSITPHWFLSNLLSEMGDIPHRHTEQCFMQALKLVAYHRRPIILDEGEHCLRDAKILETLRDITDQTEVPAIIVGYQEMKSKLARYPQISSRISALVELAPLDEAGVKNLSNELSETEIDDDLHPRIYKETKGFTRGLKECLSFLEAHAQRNGLTRITAADVAGIRSLVNNWTGGGAR